MRAMAIAANRKASGTARPMSPAGATPFSAIAAVGAMIPIEIAIASQKRSSRLRCPSEASSSPVAAVVISASLVQGRFRHETSHRSVGRVNRLVDAGQRRSAKSLLEPRIVADGGEVLVRTRLLAEPWEQLDGAPQVAEHLIIDVACERREARVVVVEARVVGHVLEAAVYGCDRVGVALLAVRGHRLLVERPRVTPVDSLVCLAVSCADDDDRRVTGRLPPRLGPDEDECPWGRVDPLAVELEGRRPVEHDVQLLLARPGLVVLVDHRAVIGGRERVDPECVNPEMLAHRDVPATPLDVVEARDLPLRFVVP